MRKYRVKLWQKSDLAFRVETDINRRKTCKGDFLGMPKKTKVKCYLTMILNLGNDSSTSTAIENNLAIMTQVKNEDFLKLEHREFGLSNRNSALPVRLTLFLWAVVDRLLNRKVFIYPVLP
jgi:hypothetical protein